MDAPLQLRLLGMAVLRGLLDGRALAEVAGTQDPIDRLRVGGRLDAEDIELLQRLVEASDQAQGRRGAGGSGAGSSPSGFSQPEDEGTPGMARSVLLMQSLPSWRRFRNLRFLAQGGMGRVFKAWDPMLKRKVALKFLLSERPDLVQRFLLEAQHQAQVDHPHVCPVFEAGEWQGQAYLCMPLLEGRTLDQVCESLSLVEKVVVMEQVAEAIHEAHRSGLIHRDLKPSNLVIERSERGLHAMVLDFGLARGLEPSGLTQQGALIGTMYYMAPEQLRGEHEQPSRAIDLYGLGATLHRILVGRPPFSEVQDLDGLLRIAEREVPSLRLLEPSLPEELDLITRKCLQPDPEQRYETARALREDLRRWREGEPILARVPSLAYRFRKWVKRRRALASVVLASAGLVLGLLGLLVGQRMFAAAQLRAMNRFQSAAERMETELRFAYLLPAHDLRGDLDKANARLGALLAQLPKAGRAERAPLNYALGRAYLLLQKPMEAQAHLERAWEGGLKESLVRGAMEEALGLSFSLRMEELRTEQDVQLRARMLAETERDYRTRMARLGVDPESAGASPRLRALRAFCLQQMPAASEAAAQARREAPMVLENWLLEARIALARADTLLRRGDLAGEQHLEQADQLFREGLDFARSHPDFLLGQVEVTFIRQANRTNGGKGEPDQIRQALRRLESLFKLDPAFPRGWSMKVSLEMLLSNQVFQGGRAAPEAIALLEGALADLDAHALDHPARVPLLTNLAVRRGEWEMSQGVDPSPGFGQVIKALEAASANPATRGAALAGLAAIHQRRGRHASWNGGDPEADFLRCVELEDELQQMRGSAGDPLAGARQAYFLTWLAHVRLDKGRDVATELDRAIRATRSALTLAAGHTYLWRYLGIALTLEGQRRVKFGGDPWPVWAEAGQALDRNLSLDPQDASALSCRGTLRIQEALQRLREGRDAGQAKAAALRDASACFALRPFMPELMLGLADLELHSPATSRDLARARAMVMAVLRKYPGNAEALALKAQLGAAR